MNAGDFISMARRRAGLTQRDVAWRVGCRQATIARWERGDRQPAFEDVQRVVEACGMELDAHLTLADRSWWPQVAVQLERAPTERVRRLAAHRGSVATLEVLEALAATGLPFVVLGEVAGALHGWPLVLSDDVVEVCARRSTADLLLEQVAAPMSAHRASGHARGLKVTEIPPGTSGYGDLARGAETVCLDSGSVEVAGLLDLLRIADASSDSDSRRRALAYQAVLDVERARAMPRQRGAVEEEIKAWLARQTPVA